jgi:hypothetical protein
MRALSRRLRPLAAEGDSGVALAIVIGIGMVMLILVATSITVALSGLRKTDTDQDWNGAMDAAYAAVEEYQSRLASDNSYYTYGNPAAAFSKSPISSSTLTLPTGAAANPAFGIGASGTWATVPGSTPVASFRYEVDNSKYAQNGAIRIRATGRVGTVTRSIIADLKQTGFIDYLWFVDYEVQDPQFTNLPQCKKHIWEGRSASCTTINYGANDSFEGPMHSNDTMTICGSTFDGTVTTSNPNSPVVVVPRNCDSPTYTGGTPVFSAQLTMPPTNVELKKETRNDLGGNEVPIPGCLYTGPTVITLTADGKMNVKSPWTIKTNIAATKAGASAPTKCGVPGDKTGQLGSVGGATIAVLPSNVIYVQNVPASSDDANYRTGTPLNFTCVGGTNPGWTFGSTQYPAVGEVAPDDSTTANPAYGCRKGDVFVKGEFDGAMTIAAENYVYVTGDLYYEDETTDILGLVGNGAVWVWNPMKTSGYGVAPLLTDNGRTIEAAILSVAHTFQLQNFDRGGTSRGELKILGSIAQTYRGTVAQGNVGYTKKYRYDERFSYMAPPKFLSPVSSSYGVTQFASVAAAFTATGATP